MNLPRKHHYIPRFLLKQFGVGKKKQVWVFDKVEGKKFTTSPDNIAAKRDLYSIDYEGSVASIEPSLADLEGRCASVLKKVIVDDSINDLSIDDKVHIAVLMVHLFLRSPNSAISWNATMESIREQIRDEGSNPDNIEQLKPLSPEEEKLVRIQLLQNLPAKMAPYLVMKRWALHSAISGCRFFLSDNPVVMHNEKKIEGLGNLGLNVPGIEIYLPISSNRCLAMYCPSHFGGSPHIPTESPSFLAIQEMIQNKALMNQKLEEIYPPLKEGKLWALPHDSVRFLNSLQVWSAERYLFSSRSDFALAEKMIAENGSLRSGPRFSVIHEFRRHP